MKKEMYFLMTLLASVWLMISLSGYQVSAAETGNEDKEIQALYQKAIGEKKVDPNKYTFEAFRENYKLGKASYYQMKDIVGKGLDYNTWFGEIEYYGAFPDGEGHSPSEAKTNTMLRGSQTTNGNKLKKAIKKGDILIIKGGGSASLDFGHAAIATSDNYILEMTGGKGVWNWAVVGISNNNNQFSKQNWIFGSKNPEQGVIPKRHISSWVQLWRVPDKNIANKAASYADKTFWNSKHKYKKNKYIDYRMTSYPSTKNPNYCSKMVMQAYYWGSGNAAVISSSAMGLTFITPAALPNLFEGKYRPHKVGTY